MSRFPPDIEYAERGQGPALLFVPGSFATTAAWKPVIERLGEGYRCVTTSLLGYGLTAERRPLGDSATTQQTEVLDAIFERIAAPVHVVAHSFGGVCVLAHALHGRHKAASFTLVEAAPMSILKAAGDAALFAGFAALREVFFAEFAAGQPDAVRHIIDFYGGAGMFDSFPAKVREFVMATTQSNVHDWSYVTWFAPSLADYGRITAPTRVIRGANSHPAMIRIAELLAAHLPNASLETIEGAGHFLLTTHPGEVAKSIIAHVKATPG